MDTSTQRLCAWTGPGFMVLFLVGWALFVGWLPPPDPGDSAEEVVAMYRDDKTQIRIGLIIAGFASALLCTYFAAISAQIKRMEDGNGVLAYAQLVTGAFNVVGFLIPIGIWEAATYRLDRDPEDTQMLHDLGWFPFFALAGTFVLQCIIIGIAVLRDRRVDPVFPRWAGYFNLWVALLFFPGLFIVMVKDGPIAWNGLFTWWMELVAFYAWFVVNTMLLLRAISRQAAEEAELAVRRSPDAVAAELVDLRAHVERLNSSIATLGSTAEAPRA